MTKGLRQTGRTSRMLIEAHSLARLGRAVYIIAANQRHAEQLESEITPMLGIQVNTESELGWSLDWDTLTLQGAHPNCVVLIDHYAIEQRFAKVISMLHRWDK